MKRERHSSRHATMFGRQLVERGNGLGVAQNDRDLPTRGGIGSLALSAGLGLHGLAAKRLGNAGQPFFKEASVLNNSALVVRRQFLVASGLRFNRETRTVKGEARGAGGIAVIHRAEVFKGQRHVEHFIPRVGPIPTMRLSYPVTSDVSTTVRREAGQIWGQK